MKPGLQSLDAVLAEAKANSDRLEELFGVPVLLLAGEDDESDDDTTVTEAGGTVRSSGARTDALTMSLVVPLQPRLATGDTRKLSFGRSEVCDLVLPYAEVSKHHGNLEQLGTDWYLGDVGSTNGTLVNGKKVGRVAVQLVEGAVIELGKVQARFLSAAGFVQLLRVRLAFG